MNYHFFGFALKTLYLSWKYSIRNFLIRMRMLLKGVKIERGTRIAGGGKLDFFQNSSIQRFGVLNAGVNASIKVGKKTRIGAFAVISAAESIEIGENVLIADRVFISDHQHESSDPVIPIIEQGVGSAKPVKIGDGCWLGINVCIMPGVFLGSGCIVGAGAIVTSSFPANSVIAGVPARLINKRF